MSLLRGCGVFRSTAMVFSFVKPELELRLFVSFTDQEIFDPQCSKNNRTLQFNSSAFRKRAFDGNHNDGKGAGQSKN